jgi:hypothetical protein
VILTLLAESGVGSKNIVPLRTDSDEADKHRSSTFDIAIDNTRPVAAGRDRERPMTRFGYRGHPWIKIAGAFSAFPVVH